MWWEGKIKAPNVSFKLGNFDTIKLHKKLKIVPFSSLFELFTKSKVEGYEVTIEVFVTSTYKTSDFFLFVLSEVFKAKKN